MNPHNPIDPEKDRYYVCGREHRCRYCNTPTNRDPRDYTSEEHETGCPVYRWIAEQDGQKRLFEVNQ